MLLNDELLALGLELDAPPPEPASDRRADGGADDADAPLPLLLPLPRRLDGPPDSSSEASSLRAEERQAGTVLLRLRYGRYVVGARAQSDCGAYNDACMIETHHNLLEASRQTPLSAVKHTKTQLLLFPRWADIGEQPSP